MRTLGHIFLRLMPSCQRNEIAMKGSLHTLENGRYGKGQSIQKRSWTAERFRISWSAERRRRNWGWNAECFSIPAPPPSFGRTTASH